MANVSGTGLSSGPRRPHDPILANILNFKCSKNNSDVQVRPSPTQKANHRMYNLDPESAQYSHVSQINLQQLKSL